MKWIAAHKRILIDLGVMLLGLLLIGGGLAMKDPAVAMLTVGALLYATVIVTRVLGFVASRKARG